MSKVALIRCESYEYGKVRSAIRHGLNLIGGAEIFVKKGQRLLLKPNLLVGEAPEKCVTTHPAVFRAVAEIIKETGAVVSYGDSPAIGSTSAAARKCGIRAEAEDLTLGFATCCALGKIEFAFNPSGMHRKLYTCLGQLHATVAAQEKRPREEPFELGNTDRKRRL